MKTRAQRLREEREATARIREAAELCSQGIIADPYSPEDERTILAEELRREAAGGMSMFDRLSPAQRKRVLEIHSRDDLSMEEMFEELGKVVPGLF